MDFEWVLMILGDFDCLLVEWWILVVWGVIFSGFMWRVRSTIQRNVVFACKNYIYLTTSSAQAKQVSSQQGKTAAGRQFWSANNAKQAKTSKK